VSAEDWEPIGENWRTVAERSFINIAISKAAANGSFVLVYGSKLLAIEWLLSL
jgi:hypothetical protein